jgi:hypothetical protein
VAIVRKGTVEHGRCNIFTISVLNTMGDGRA